MEVVETERKSPVLNHPSLPCLSRHYTINLTAGCPNRCRYCYAQSFAHHPGWGKVLFYANSLDLLRRELPRKRKRPQLVFFSTACEPFVPDERILSCLYGVMETLLETSVAIRISTKCSVPEDFLLLFARHRELVHVQVGLTTVDDDVRRFLEPRAPSVAQRLANLQNLLRKGINTWVRMDPLTPELTDTEASFRALCREIASCGIARAIASPLFLRPANYGLLRLRYKGWSFGRMARRLYTHRFEDFCAGGTIWLPDTDHRRRKHGELGSIASEHGIDLTFCSCTNPDLTSDVCHAPARRAALAQPRLFRT